MISSSKKDESEKVEEGKVVRREFNYNSFSRSFFLSDGINQEDIGATYKDGVLYVRLAKKVADDEAKKTIEIL